MWPRLRVACTLTLISYIDDACHSFFNGRCLWERRDAL